MMMDRRPFVAGLLVERGDLMVVTGLGSSTYDVAACGDHPLNFYLWSAMGSTAMVGLGLALARPDRRVAVITGDGDMLMGMGSLATIGVKQPKNLSIVVLDNRHYSATGMQASHTAAGIDLAATAQACRFAARRAGIGDRQRGRDAGTAAHRTRPDLHPCAGRGRRPAAHHSEPRRLRHQAAVHAGVGEAGVARLLVIPPEPARRPCSRARNPYHACDYGFRARALRAPRNDGGEIASTGTCSERVTPAWRRRT